MAHCPLAATAPACETSMELQEWATTMFGRPNNLNGNFIPRKITESKKLAATARESNKLRHCNGPTHSLSKNPPGLQF